MEAARIPWRPLGRILVEQGLLTSHELETALEQQERTGKRLGETIVECGFVSGPELSNALASQYGIELTTETGFGTGLRTQIQRRHERERRGSRPTLVEVHQLEAAVEEPEIDEEDDHSAEASLLTQLEEQWAKLAAAEALIAEHEQELAGLAAQRDRRREQAARLARRARRGTTSVENDSDLREELNRLANEVRSHRDERDRLEHEGGHVHERLAVAEASLLERDGELGEARDALASAQTALGEQDVRFQELAAEFERVVQSRTEIEGALREAQQSLSAHERDLQELRHELGRRRAQAVRLARRLRRHRHDTHETQRHEDDAVRTRAELEQAHEAIAAAEAARVEQESRLDELGAELERVVHSRTEVESALADARATLEQREHMLGELREQLERGHEADLAPLRNELEQAHEAIAAAEAARVEQESRLDELGAELERVVHSRTEVESALTDARATLEQREHSLDALRRDLVRRSEQASRLARRARSERQRAAAVQDYEDDLARLRHELDRAEEAVAATSATAQNLTAAHAALLGKLERRRAQALRLTNRLRTLRQVDEQQLSQIERLVADVRGCDAEIARLRDENERARARTKRFLERLRRERGRAEHHETAPEPEPAPEITSHLVFIELPDRYALVERPGPAPPRHAQLELPELDRRLFVVGARPSPLPNDARPCVVAQADAYAN